MKAFVIGATGIIGNHVVRSLVARGLPVRVFSRGLTPSKNLEDLNTVEIVKGDLYDTDSLARAMEGCTHLFHTAPYYPLNMFDTPGHLKSAMQGIESVLTAAKKVGIKRMVYTSTLTTIGKPHHSTELADETCVYDLTAKQPHPYFAIKPLMEARMREAALKGEMDVVMVNPTGCFGPYELKPVELCLIPQLINKKIPAYIECPMNVVNVADVGEGHVLAMEKGRSGERYILGGFNTTTGDTIKKICEVAGVSPPKVKVPVKMALVPTLLSEYMARMTHSIPKLTSLGIRFAQYGQHLSIQKAVTELGYQPTSMEKCYEKAINWYQKIGYC
ncbi:NAD-dependent epimerase/dehydratase family protein [bacterium]|nr:NAD-dependent epimerase/dehydratase family protein [bacterium]